MITNFTNVAFFGLARDARLIIISTAVLGISFFGIQMLLNVLYILRLGYSVEYVGLFNASGAFTYILSSLPAAAVGNRIGLRASMVLGGVITVLGLAILPAVEYVPATLHTSWPILSQIVLTVGWALISINQVPALMAVTTVQNRTSAYALNGVARGVGTFVGTIVGGFLPMIFAQLLRDHVEAPGPYRAALWMGAGLALLGLIPLLLIRPAEPVSHSVKQEATTPFPLWPVGLLVLHVYLSQLGPASCQFFCSAYMDTTLLLSAATIGLLTGIGQFTTILAPLLTPRLAHRYGNGWTLMTASLGTAVSLLPLALIPHWAAAGTGRLGALALAAIWMPALQVFQMELVDPRWRTLTYGIVSMAMGCAYASVGFVGGRLVATWGYATLFSLAIGMTLLGTALMWGMLRSPRLRMLQARS
ncbi:MAG: MFS transporter [Caldilineaceae bacterium]